MTMGLYADGYRGLTIHELELMRPYVRVLALRDNQGARERLEAIEWLLQDPEKKLVYPRAQRVRKKREAPPWARSR